MMKLVLLAVAEHFTRPKNSITLALNIAFASRKTFVYYHFRVRCRFDAYVCMYSFIFGCVPRMNELNRENERQT